MSPNLFANPIELLRQERLKKERLRKERIEKQNKELQKENDRIKQIGVITSEHLKDDEDVPETQLIPLNEISRIESARSDKRSHSSGKLDYSGAGIKMRLLKDLYHIQNTEKKEDVKETREFLD